VGWRRSVFKSATGTSHQLLERTRHLESSPGKGRHRWRLRCRARLCSAHGKAQRHVVHRRPGLMNPLRIGQCGGSVGSALAIDESTRHQMMANAR
jgi:hypothetical protein